MKLFFEAFDEEAYNELSDLISCSSKLNEVNGELNKFLVEWEYFPYLDRILVDEIKALQMDIKSFTDHCLSDFKDRHSNPNKG